MPQSQPEKTGFLKVFVTVSVSLTALGAGGVLALTGSGDAAEAVWTAGVVAVLVPLGISVVLALAKGHYGVDLIALLAMVTALLVGEYLAAAIVAVMLSGGNALEAFAQRRARRELTALLARAPQIAHRRSGETWEEVAVASLEPGDVVLVRAGETVPVDGILLGEATLDESTMTGESLPVTRAIGTEIASGISNAGEAFEIRALRAAAQSAYNALVKLVEAAETERAPFVRTADRYAVIFLPVTLVLASAAWALSGDPVRAVAVLVVATPCPLILAAPIALISGLSRAARLGVIVKGGTAMERLGEARSVLLDKTGTLTLGSPRIREVIAFDQTEEDELLRLAASVDQLSAHVLAEALVSAAEERGLALERPSGVVEQPGQGIEGGLPAGRITVGSASWLESRGCSTGEALQRLDAASSANSFARVLVGRNNDVIGAIIVADEVRDDAARTVRRLRDVGVREVVMATGDHRAVAEEIAASLDLDRVHAQMSPEGKLEAVRSMRADPGLRPVVMVGDGVNDAPALALADVGIAMGGHGATVSAETADVVIAVDRIERVADALAIGQRTLSIARQSVIAGIAMSIVAMFFAAAGLLPPVAGALLQEAIDVAVIMNALRALRGQANL